MVFVRQDFHPRISLNADEISPTKDVETKSFCQSEPFNEHHIE